MEPGTEQTVLTVSAAGYIGPELKETSAKNQSSDSSQIDARNRNGELTGRSDRNETFGRETARTRKTGGGRKSVKERDRQPKVVRVENRMIGKRGVLR